MSRNPYSSGSTSRYSNNSPPPTSASQVFNDDFIKTFTRQEDELHAAQQKLQHLRDEVKYFRINQQQQKEIDDHIEELMEHFRESVKEVEFSQYISTDTPQDVIRQLQKFEKHPPSDRNFKQKLFELKLDKYERLVYNLQRYDRGSEAFPEAAVGDLFRAQHGMQLNAQRSARRHNEERRDTLDEGMLEPLFNNSHANAYQDDSESSTTSVTPRDGNRVRNDTITHEAMAE